MTITKNRKYYLDALRILAAFGVLFNHTEGFHLYLTQAADGSPGSFLRVVLSVLTKMSVPLFFMISGALLLGREESYAALFRKRICRYCLILTLCSALYYSLVSGKRIFSVQFVKDLLAGDIAPSYWFLFSYLAFLFALPFLRKLAAGMTGKDFLFLLILRVLFRSVAPLYHYWADVLSLESFYIRPDFQLPFAASDFIFYSLAGYWIATDPSVGAWKTKDILRAVCAAAAGTLIAAATTYHQGVHSGFTQDYLTVFLCISVCTVFALGRILFERVSVPKRACKALVAISELTLGVYLFDPFLTYYLYYMFGGAVDRMLYSFLWCGFSFCVCCLVTYILKRLPVVKHLF